MKKSELETPFNSCTFEDLASVLLSMLMESNSNLESFFNSIENRLLNEDTLYTYRLNKSVENSESDTLEKLDYYIEFKNAFNKTVALQTVEEGGGLTYGVELFMEGIGRIRFSIK